jgi:hypothetical protein
MQIVSLNYKDSRLGPVKLYGHIENGKAFLRQIYKGGVPILFFERGDRNMPTTFSRTEIAIFEGMLLSAKPRKKRERKPLPLSAYVTEVPEPGPSRSYGGLYSLLNIRKSNAVEIPVNCSFSNGTEL